MLGPRELTHHQLARSSPQIGGGLLTTSKSNCQVGVSKRMLILGLFFIGALGWRANGLGAQWPPLPVI